MKLNQLDILTSLCINISVFLGHMWRLQIPFSPHIWLQPEFSKISWGRSIANNETLKKPISAWVPLCKREKNISPIFPPKITSKQPIRNEFRWETANQVNLVFSVSHLSGPGLHPEAQKMFTGHETTIQVMLPKTPSFPSKLDNHALTRIFRVVRGQWVCWGDYHIVSKSLCGMWGTGK